MRGHFPYMGARPPHAFPHFRAIPAGIPAGIPAAALLTFLRNPVRVTKHKTT